MHEPPYCGRRDRGQGQGEVDTPRQGNPNEGRLGNSGQEKARQQGAGWRRGAQSVLRKDEESARISKKNVTGSYLMSIASFQRRGVRHAMSRKGGCAKNRRSVVEDAVTNPSVRGTGGDLRKDARRQRRIVFSFSSHPKSDEPCFNVERLPHKDRIKRLMFGVWVLAVHVDVGGVLCQSFVVATRGVVRQ